MVSTLAAIVTSSSAPGTVFVDQFPAVVHKLSPAAPVQLIATGLQRFESKSAASHEGPP
jgi:hypothetical protein